MKTVLKLAATLALLATPALAQSTPATSAGSASSSSTSPNGSQEVLPGPAGGTSGTVELPGGGTVTESHPAAEQSGQTGSGTTAPASQTPAAGSAAKPAPGDGASKPN